MTDFKKDCDKCKFKDWRICKSCSRYYHDQFQPIKEDKPINLKSKTDSTSK